MNLVRALASIAAAVLIAVSSANVRAEEHAITGGGGPGLLGPAEELVSKLEKEGADERRIAGRKQALNQAKRALERAKGALAAGDVAHARLLSDLAVEWAAAGQAALRAIDFEDAGRAVSSELQAVRDAKDRVRTLAAEIENQRARLLGDLSRAEERARDKAKPSAASKKTDAGKAVSR